MSFPTDYFFAELIEFLTDGQVTYSEELLNLIYSWIWTPFDGEEKLRIVPSEDRATWPDWKSEAFEKLVSPEAQNGFKQMGYML